MGDQEAAPKPFNEIAKSFDPLMPKETYEGLRDHYFNTVIRPKIESGASVRATYEDFVKQTEREPLLTATQKATTALGVAATSAAKELLAPVEGVSPAAKTLTNRADKQQKVLAALMEREGISPKAPEMIGSVLGSAPALIATWEMGGPIAETLAGAVLKTAKTAEAAQRILRGSISFASFEAARENDGDRLLAGLKGAAIGAGFEALPALASVLKRSGVENPEEVLQQTMQGASVDPKLDLKIADRIQKDTQFARQEGRPSGGFQLTPAKPGVRAVMKDKTGADVIIPIRPNKEGTALSGFKQIIDAGGSFEHFEAHPDDISLMNRFGNMIQEQQGVKYQTVTVTSTNNTAVVDRAIQEGIPAEAVGPDRVELHVVPVEHPVMQTGSKGSSEAIAATTRPTEETVEAALDNFKNAAGKGLESKERNFFRRQLEVVWDPQYPAGAKTGAIAIIRRNFPEMLPPGLQEKNVTEQVLNRVEASTGAQMGDEELDKILTEYGIDPQSEAVDRDLMKEKGRVFTDEWAEAQTKGASKAATYRQMAEEAHGVDVTTFGEPKPSSRLRIGVEGEEVTLNGKSYPSLQKALDDSGEYKFLVKPQAGQTSVWEQLSSASLDGRMMGSIEDVSKGELPSTVEALTSKGNGVTIMRGWEPNKWEVVYYRPEDSESLRPLLRNYDDYITKEAGRSLNSFDKLPTSVGPEAHTALGKAFGIPEDEIETFLESTGGSGDMSMLNSVKSTVNIKRKPSGLTSVIDPELMNRVFPGAGGVHWSVGAVLDRLGIEMPAGMKGAESLVVLAKDSGKETVYHEGLHNLIYKFGRARSGVIYFGGSIRNIPDEMKGVALGIAEGLGQDDVYAGIPFRIRAEEAFVHASEAVRFDNQPYLDQLARWDTSVEHVKNFVNRTAESFLEDLDGRVDSVPKRQFQRKLTDLIRRTDVNEQSAFRRTIGGAKEVWYDAETKKYQVLDPSGDTTHTFDSAGEVFDHLYDHDLSELAASPSYSAELRGVRGSFVPHGSEPNGRLPNPDAPPDLRRGGFSLAPLTGWIRPYLAWTSDTHEYLNKLFQASGSYLPLYEHTRAVDIAVRDGTPWLDEWQEKVATNLRTVDSKKQYDMFQYLTNQPEKRLGYKGPMTDVLPSPDLPQQVRTTFKGTPLDLPEHLKGQRTYTYQGEIPGLGPKYNLTPKEVDIAENHYALLKELQDDTHLNILNFMHSKYPLIRGGLDLDAVFGPLKEVSRMDFWERAIRDEQSFDPADAHLGRFTHFLLKSGFEKKFINEPLADLVKTIGLTSKDGAHVIPNALRAPMENYVKYIKGIPDGSQQAINTVLGGFGESLEKRVTALNTHLPDFAKLPEGKIVPQQVMNRFMTLSYAANLGLRPAIALRDSMQAFTIGLPLFGPSRFAKGMSEALTSAGWKFADDMGALLRSKEVGEMYGDIIREIPQGGKGIMQTLTRWSNHLLQPSRFGHNVSRAIAFHSEYHGAVEAVEAYRAGAISLENLMKDPVMWFADKPESARLLKLISDGDVPVKDAAREMALHATDLSMWAYRRGAQPAALRTGAGRIFGQYGMWPMNYMDFLRRLGSKYSEHPAEALKMSAMFAAVNYSAVEAFNSLGADVGHWFWQSPAGFGGSPHYQFVEDLFKAPKEDMEGRAARKRVLEYPLNFVPASNEVRSILQGMEQGGTTSQDFWRTMGVKPMPEVEQDEDFQKWLAEESGFKQRRTR